MYRNSINTSLIGFQKNGGKYLNRFLNKLLSFKLLSLKLLSIKLLPIMLSSIEKIKLSHLSSIYDDILLVD